MKRVVLYVFLGILLIGALAFTYNSGKNSAESTARIATKAQKDADTYDLLAKRIFLENPNDVWVNFSSLRKSLNSYFVDNNLSGSVYFEYLPTGTSIRINSDYSQVAASLIKLPVAMELYKAHELGKVDLDQKIKLKKEWLNSGYGDLYKKGVGYELTVRDAARIMLTDSDNTALRAVLAAYDSKLDTDQLAFGSLDIAFTQNNDGSTNIGARSYASFLKCLYFACYNDYKDSQEILDYLTRTKFNNRLVAGVDNKSIKIAHKIGVFNTKVQSDCGIVYYPDRNYVLCAMVEGTDPTSSAHIAGISSTVFSFIDKIQK